MAKKVITKIKEVIKKPLHWTWADVKDSLDFFKEEARLLKAAKKKEEA